jgi:hypothetical protein
MDTVNSFYEIVNNKANDKYKTAESTIYDELKDKEKTYYDTINRVIDYKQKEQEKLNYFQYTTIQEFVINIFITLNIIFKEIIELDFYNENFFKLFLEIFTKGTRLIYIGTILILLAFILLLIELTDTPPQIIYKEKI